MNREQRRVVVLIWFVSSVASLEIDTLDGGYKNLLVSISKAVPYDESIIEDIKALFRSSSEFLHRATNGRVYFKQVTIEIPKAWPRRENARNVSLSSFEQSDIRIDLPSEPYGDRPFTQQLRPCGQPGDFIQLTPRFLAQLRNSTGNQPLNMAYIFVHQWAHFRYGVFDEHGCHGDNQYPLTYCHSGKVKLNACSERIAFAARTATGGKCSVDKVCRLSEDCVVSLQHSGSGHPIESSIMFMPRVGNVSQFCDDAVGGIQHNPFAPNKQNRLCQQKSTWEVISGNADFQKLPKPDISKRIEISFVVTQETNVTQRVVLVLDVSSSMQNYRRLEFLKEAITRYVNGMANDLRRLAILTFSKSANVVHPLTLVNAGTKPGFLSAIKRLKTEGPTCIGCGLRDAVVHLKNSTETTEGATIVLVSDGEGNTGPKIKSVMPRLLKAKVVVSTLAVGGTAAEKLEKLASQTRGKAYAFQDMQGNMALEMEAAFVEATTPSLEKASRAHALVDTVESLHGLLKRTFQVDSSVGNETVVYVKVNDRHKAQIEAWLVDPSGQRCQACHKTSTAAGIAIAMPSPAEVGTWILHLQSSDKAEVNIQVKSKSRREGVEPIQLSCTMANLLVDRPDAAVVYAKISRGKKVALGASVFADVRGPKPGRNSTLQLHDDGREPDNHAGDGTYSGYFTKFTGKGRYTVTAHVLHQNGTRLAYPLDSSACVVGIATHNTSDESTGASLDFASEHPIDDFNLVNTTAIATSDNGTSIEIVDPFERVASGGSFQVMEPIFESHVPPGNIRDLSAANARPGENGTLLVELTFTWPGAHLTSGKASSVEIRASKDYAKLKSDFGSQTEIAKLNVTERSLEHVVVVSLPSILATPQQDSASTWNAYVAARATNKDGLKSNTSNVVPLYYTPPQVITTLPMTTLTTSGATSTIATTKPTTTNAETTTTEIITPKERATTNAANTTAEISTPTERATTNTETTTAEIPTPTEHTTTNAAIMAAEIKTPTERATTKTATTTGEITTPTERATTNAATTTTEITTPAERTTTNTSTTTAEISTRTERGTTKAATMTAEITTPTEGATTNAATTTAEITTPTERATTNAPTTTAEITKPTKRATTNATTATAEITTPRERATTKASSTPAEINTTTEPATTKAATSTAEITAPTERATTNAANTSAEITAPKEGATTNAETSTVEITTPTQRDTTNAATTTTEIITPAERATTNASTTTTEISTPTERGTTKAATTTAEITSPTEGATKNAATTTAEITPTERATKSSLTTIPLRSTTEASLSRVTTGMSTAAPSTKWPATSTLLTTTLSPATLPTTAEERSIETPTTTEASTDSRIPSIVNGYHTTGTGTPSLTVFLTLSKWVPIGGAIAAAIFAILFALVRRKNRRNYRSSSRRARKESNASALLA